MYWITAQEKMGADDVRDLYRRSVVPDRLCLVYFRCPNPHGLYGNHDAAGGVVYWNYLIVVFTGVYEKKLVTIAPVVTRALSVARYPLW